MHCPECGHPNDHDAKFCIKCWGKIISDRFMSPSAREFSKFKYNSSQISAQESSFYSGNSAIHFNTGSKESRSVTAMSVVGFFFGLIAMLESFIPWLSSLAFYIGIIAVTISAVGLGIAFSQKSKKTFLFITIIISLIGVLISRWQ